MVVKVVIRGVRGRDYTIDLCDTEEQFKNITVRELKRQVAAKVSYYDETKRLRFDGQDLDIDDRRLSDYGVTNMSVITVASPSPGCGLM